MPNKKAKDLGACIQCYKGKCVRTYHVTCALENKILLTDDFQCFCQQHDDVGHKYFQIIKFYY
jgi:hypothetical protein